MKKHPAHQCLITVSENDDSAEARKIHENLKDEIEFDLKLEAKRSPFVAIVHDPDGVFRGGLRGFSHWNWLYISHIWIETAFRSGGLGAQLLMHAEHEAKKRKLSGLYVDTFNLQTRDFYIRHGFKEFGRIPNFPPGQTRFFLVKAQ